MPNNNEKNDVFYDDSKWAPVVEKNKELLLDMIVNNDELMLSGAAHEMFIYLEGLEARGLAKYKVCMFTRFNAEKRGGNLYDYGDGTKGDAFFKVAQRIEILIDNIDIARIHEEYMEYNRSQTFWNVSE